MMGSKELAVLLVTMVAIHATSGRQVVTVDTKVGTINGFVQHTTFLGKTSAIDRFYGVPYAEPPTGKRRFHKAIPKAPFLDPFDAFKNGSMCYQPNVPNPLPEFTFSYSEDCLNLNIFAPHQRQTSGEQLPVMVWLYGGAFTFGYADQYFGDNIAAHGNVIVVVINYRVSLWGFLSTGNDVVPGNAGLWDQHLAIKWVHDNIEAFGGDTSRITLFGESAGSVSAIYQALYPRSKGLFQRILGQSGSVESWWASGKDVSKSTKYLASLTNCDGDDWTNMVTCLKNVSCNTFVELVSDFKYGLLELPFPFVPVQDGDFIRYDPRSAFKGDLPEDILEMFKSVDLLTGVNSAEGSFGLMPFMGVYDPEAFLPTKVDFEGNFIPALLKALYGEPSNTLLHDVISSEYTPWNKPEDPTELRHEYVNMHGDAAFTAPLYNTVNNHVRVTSDASTYLYVFDETPDTSIFANVSWLKGLAHLEDIFFTFGYKTDNGNGIGLPATDWEQRLSGDIITLWTNFAKTGNPNKPVSLGLDWLPYTAKHQHYLQISRDMTSQNVKQRWNTRRANFWSNTVPKIATLHNQCAAATEIPEPMKDGSCEQDLP